MEPNPHRIVLDLEPGVPVRGNVSAAGFVRPFTGWISLLGALEAAIGSGQETDPRDAGPSYFSGRNEEGKDDCTH